MLKEICGVRQIEGESRRRWFSDEASELDLIVWFDESDEVIEFELNYTHSGSERAIRWRKDSGYAHFKVDDGENRPGKPKSSPTLMSDGPFPYRTVAETFMAKSGHIESGLCDFIHRQLMRYGTRP